MPKLRELYEKNGVLFAVLWIILYCAIMTPVIGKHGEDSPVMMLALLIVAGLIFGFVKANRLEAETGLDGWPKDTRRYLYFIPMWILATGNLWGGVSLNYKGTGQVIAILSMLLVGFIEEMIFRGFLFRALLKTNSVLSAVIISAATFGMGHLVNLLSGQATKETVIQVFFAISLGFVFTMVYYKSGKLLPCIIAHSLIDAFSTVAADSHMGDMIYVWTTIIVSAVYCIYLWKLPGNGFEEDRNGKQ